MSETNRLLRNQKLSRVKKLIKKGFHRNFFNNFHEYSQNIFKLWKDLASNLGVNPKTKTVTFAIKMFYYTIRIYHKDKALQVPYEIPIPVDLRVFKITQKLGLITTREFSQKNAEQVRRIWQRIAEFSRVPPIHIDVLLWMLGSLRQYEGLLLGLAKKHEKVSIILEIISMVK